MSDTEETIPSSNPETAVQEAGQPETEENVKHEEETNDDPAPAAEEDPTKEDTDANISIAVEDNITSEEILEAADAEETKEPTEALDQDDAVKEEKSDDAPEANVDTEDAVNEENIKKDPAPEDEVPKDEDVEMKDEEEEKTAGKKKKKKTSTPRKKRSAAAAATPSSSASKRQRKSTTSFSPMDFKEERDNKKIEIPAGRGVKLDTVEIIKANVSKMKNTDPILAELHKFLLGGPGGCLGKGRTGKKLLKKHVLEFSGYLPDIEEGDKEGEEIERDAEERMQTKAENMSLPLVKTLCDILSINRGPEEGKEGKKGKLATKPILVDRLLDFLSDPSEEGIDATAGVTTGKKRGPKPKKHLDEEESEEEDDEMEDEDEENESDGVPSQKMLKRFVKAYLICFNLDTASEEHAFQIATEKFGDALSGKKDALANLVKEALAKEKFRLDTA